jgi:hypothetical protein
MKEWFKARNVWGAAITALSDEEAGRLVKAIWAYTMNGEVTEIDGAGKGIFALILMTLGQDEERDAEISEKRSKATEEYRHQKNAGDNKKDQMISSDIKSNQLISNDDNKNKNQNKRKIKEQESESDSFMDADDAQEIQKDHDRILDAAEDAGFKMSNDVRASLIALYADNGLTKMLDALKSCVDHGAPNLAYLKAVLKGESKKKIVNAQKYDQRDYDEVENEAYQRMIRGIVS